MGKLKNAFERKTDAFLRETGVKYGYETEALDYTIHSRYWPDFVIYRDGGCLYVECKGYLRRDDRKKLATVKQQYPDIDLRILFYEQPKEGVVRWCKKIGIPWNVGTIPLEWLENTFIKPLVGKNV